MYMMAAGLITHVVPIFIYRTLAQISSLAKYSLGKIRKNRLTMMRLLRTVMKKQRRS